MTRASSVSSLLPARSQVWRPKAGMILTIDGESVLGAAELFMSCWTIEATGNAKANADDNSYITVFFVSASPTVKSSFFLFNIKKKEDYFVLHALPLLNGYG